MNQKKSGAGGTIIILVVIAIFIAIAFASCGGGSSHSSGNTSKCTICGKAATHTFQGSGYCTTHYNDAVRWAMDHTKN